MKPSTSLFLILLVLSINIPTHSALDKGVAFRMDDVQDTFLKTEQLTILNLFLDEEIPLTIGVITGYFGDDFELVNALKESYDAGLLEFAVHGFGNENLTQLNYDEQKNLISNGLNALRAVFEDLELVTFIPPMQEFNQDTILACIEYGLKILSSDLTRDLPPWDTSIRHLPQTVDSASYYDERFHEVDPNVTVTNIQSSIDTYGYAIVTLHPQQFAVFDEAFNYLGINLTKIDNFRVLINLVKSNFSTTTIAGLAGFQWKREAPIEIPLMSLVIPAIFIPLIIIYFISLKKKIGKKT